MEGRSKRPGNCTHGQVLTGRLSRVFFVFVNAKKIRKNMQINAGLHLLTTAEAADYLRI